jgi:hypothetical protein
MTGAPAETWRKFRFNTAPPWALVFLVLICVGIGFVVSIPLAYLVGRHAAGPLPLTRRSKRILEIPLWVGAGAITGTALLVILAVLAFSLQHDPNNPTAALVALLALYAAIPLLALGAVSLEVGFQMGALYGPVAKVMKQEAGQPDRVVELRRVHPAFVNAVLEMQRSREAPLLPQSPGSN